MSCVDLSRARRPPARAALAVPLWLALLGAGCSNAPAPAHPGASSVRAPAADGSGATGLPALAGKPRPAAAPPTGRARHWDDYRLQAAERIVALNPALTYDGPVPEPLLAIPVLEIELNADGGVRAIQVMRKPGQAVDTVQIAIDAVRRAAPFGQVSHLPRPWKFTEVFLFNDDRLFKPRSLDL